MNAETPTPVVGLTMNRFLVLLTSCLVAPAHSQVLEADKARYATDLFASICIFGEGTPESAQSAVEFRLRPLVPDARKFFLGDREGMAWAPQVKPPEFALALAEDGECLVHVRRLAPSQAEHFFKYLVKHVGDPPSVEAAPELKSTRSYGEISIQQYSFKRANGTRYTVELTTSDSPQVTCPPPAVPS